MRFALMGIFAVFFAGGSYLNFPPLVLLVWGVVLIFAVASLWTWWDDRRTRERVLGELAGPLGPATVADALRFEETRSVLRERRDEVLAVVAGRNGESAPWLGGVLQLFADDAAFLQRIIEELEGEPAAERWLEVAGALPREEHILWTLLNYWKALPESASARRAPKVHAVLAGWALDLDREAWLDDADIH